MTPKVVDKQEKRNQIIEAAVRVFAKMGFAKTKMLQIAEAAGIGKGTIYEYFQSKEELFVAVFNAFVRETESQVAKRIEKIEDPVAQLRTYFQAWLELMDDEFLEYGDVMIDIWAEGVRLHQGKDIFDLKGMYRKLRKQLGTILEEGVLLNKLRPMNTTIVSSVIIATMDGMFLQWLFEKELFDLHEAMNEFAEITIDGLLIKD